MEGHLASQVFIDPPSHSLNVPQIVIEVGMTRFTISSLWTACPSQGTGCPGDKQTLLSLMIFSVSSTGISSAEEISGMV